MSKLLNAEPSLHVKVEWREDDAPMLEVVAGPLLDLADRWREEPPAARVVTRRRQAARKATRKRPRR